MEPLALLCDEITLTLDPELVNEVRYCAAADLVRGRTLADGAGVAREAAGQTA